MLIINYSRNGHAYADGEVESLIVNHLAQSINTSRRGTRTTRPLDTIIETSTENVVLMVRTLIAEGLSDPNQIRIVWNGVDMPLDGYGRIRSWQSEFAGGIDNCIDRIISAHSRRGVF